MTKYLKMTRYYDEFLRYFEMAKIQQQECNLGVISHEQSSVDDELMKHVHLYDVIERKYAGFSQIVNDIFYGWTEEHPYWNKMQAGMATKERIEVANNWTSVKNKLDLKEWIYLFLLHRLTGSAINYARKPSGYYNSLLFKLHKEDNIDGFIKIIKNQITPFYTSVGYQFPAFPKPATGYKRGGDYFLCEYLPRLSEDVARYLETPGKKDLRQIGDFMFKWNSENGLRAYKFQYAAFIADIADWFPQFVNRETPFYYGTNAKECLQYLAVKPSIKLSEEQFLDIITQKIYEDTGAVPYNNEDIACDFIRWIENYCKVGKDYDHLDLDHVWNSSSIKDHPFGRQKAMIDLKITPTFNNITQHPSDDKVIKSVGLSIEQYKEKVNLLYV